MDDEQIIYFTKVDNLFVHNWGDNILSNLIVIFLRFKNKMK